MKRLICALAILTLATAPVAAHVTVTAEPPTGPLVPGVANPIQVTASANCAFVAVEYQANGETELFFGLTPPGLSYFNQSSDVVPFSINQCQPVNQGDPAASGNAYSTGMLYLTPSMSAPAGQDIELSISAFGNDPTTPEGGEAALVTVRIAYVGNVTLLHPATMPMVTGPGPITFLAQVATNADSMLTIKAEPSIGTVAPVAPIAVLPPAVDGLDVRTIAVVLDYTPPEGNWTETEIHIMALLTPATVEGNATSAMMHVHAHNGAQPHNHTDDGHTHDNHDGHNHGDEKESPAPFLGLGLALATAIHLRRRSTNL